MTQTVAERVIAIIAEQVAGTAVRPELTLEGFGIDSLDRFEMVITIEEQFGIDIEQECIVAWVTVQDVIDTVTNLTVGVIHVTDFGSSVRLRNGDICDNLQPYDATDYKLTAVRRKDGHMLTWTTDGCYNVDKPLHDCDIVEVLQ